MALVIGSALSKYNRRRDGSAFRDWAADAFAAALAMSGLERSDIDTLIVASESDFFTAQLNPASVLAADLGLIGAATLRVEGGGASGQLAVHAAAARIWSGAARRVAVVGVDPSASALDADTMRRLYSHSFDAWAEGMTGVTSTMLYALSWQAFASEAGATDADLAAVTQKNRANALHNPNAHLPRRHGLAEIHASPMIASPYRRLHCSPLSDGAAAIILSAPQATPSARRAAPRIIGIGASSDHPALGHREKPGHFTAKTTAMRRASQMAAVTPKDIGLAEVYDAYAGAELQGIDALGLGSSDTMTAARDGWFSADGRCPVNLSGGLMGQGAPVGATGVGQTAVCALLLEGRFHPQLQPAAPPRHALADTHGGIATTCAVTILNAGGGT